MDSRYWTFVGLTALSTAWLVWGLYGLWRQYLDPRRRALAQRLKPDDLNLPPDSSLQLRQTRLLSTTPALDRWLRGIPGVKALDHFLLQTGLTWRVAQVLSLALGLVLLAWTVGTQLAWPAVLTLALSTLGLLALAAWLQHRRSQRMVLIGLALPDALDLIARSMQAGHAFTSALQLAAKDSPPPCRWSCAPCSKRSILVWAPPRRCRPCPHGWSARTCVILWWPL